MFLCLKLMNNLSMLQSMIFSIQKALKLHLFMGCTLLLVGNCFGETWYNYLILPKINPWIILGDFNEVVRPQEIAGENQE